VCFGSNLKITKLNLNEQFAERINAEALFETHLLIIILYSTIRKQTHIIHYIYLNKCPLRKYIFFNRKSTYFYFPFLYWSKHIFSVHIIFLLYKMIYIFLLTVCYFCGPKQYFFLCPIEFCVKNPCIGLIQMDRVSLVTYCRHFDSKTMFPVHLYLVWKRTPPRLVMHQIT